MKFRKKPVVIEAVHYMPDTCRAVHVFLGYQHDDEQSCDSGIEIETLEGTHHASVGDWIIRGVKGEFYPCKPDIFDATYERVEESPAKEEVWTQEEIDAAKESARKLREKLDW